MIFWGPALMKGPDTCQRMKVFMADNPFEIASAVKRRNPCVIVESCRPIQGSWELHHVMRQISQSMCQDTGRREAVAPVLVALAGLSGGQGPMVALSRGNCA